MPSPSSRGRGPRGWFHRWRDHRLRRRERRRLHAEARRALDELFHSRPGVLQQGRLRPDQRGRCLILEVDPAPGGGGDEGLEHGGAARGNPAPLAAVRFGIVRHPKSHRWAPRGEDVLEVLEYRPRPGTLRLVASRNLTRARDRGR